ncbi:hypothetical protein DFQ27_001947 [Actinomortierella ambigua]|uniref:Cyclin-domain-containing protein n=1 Tax=Actinomortierella ambigua TaxID=1343610 RepID=A0A9P6QN65_9FUNG|nr:hypothetical protein DFQ27_001947 [Actinomortierella ambigua]
MALRDPITLFHSRAIPPISIAAYLARIHRFIPLTNEVLLNAVIYLARLGAAGSGAAEEDAATALAEAAVAAGASSATSTLATTTTATTTTTVIETTTTATTVDAGSKLSESKLGQTLNRNMIHHGPALVADWLLSSFAVDGSIAPTSPSTTTTTQEGQAVAAVALLATIGSDTSCPSLPSSFPTTTTSTTISSTSTSPSSSYIPACHDAQVSNNCNHDCTNGSSNTHELSKGPLVGCCCTTNNSKVWVASAPAASASSQQLLNPTTSALLHTTAACSTASQPTTFPRASKRPRSPATPSMCTAASGTAANIDGNDRICSIAGVEEDEMEGTASKRIKQQQQQPKQQQHPRLSILAESPTSPPSSLLADNKAMSLRLSCLGPALPQTAVAPNGFRLNSLNIHRLLITALMVAAKFTSDLYYSNARYAKYGGLRLEELNQLELEFLFSIKFDLNVKVPHIEQVGRLLHAFEQVASPSSSSASSSSTMVSASPSPASTPSMMAMDRFCASSAASSSSSSSSSATSAEKKDAAAAAASSSLVAHSHASTTRQQQQQYPQSSLVREPYPASASAAPDASNHHGRASCQGQGQCQGQQQSPLAATTHASTVHMQSSSKAVGHLLSPPEEKQHGWDD